jgi:hypothetical protein
MDNVKNELTGPRVFVVVADNKKGKIHLTGGYAKPEMNKSMCGAKLGMKTVVDARDIAPREEYRHAHRWCFRCLGMLDFEALDQKVLFSAIEISAGTYGQLVVAGHVSRNKPKLILTPAPEKSEWRIFERD